MSVEKATEALEGLQRDEAQAGLDSGIFPRQSLDSHEARGRYEAQSVDAGSGWLVDAGVAMASLPPHSVWDVRLARLEPESNSAASIGSEPLSGPRRGEYLGRYQILERIGWGASSSVYLAADRRLGHAVALKVLERTGARARLLFEAEAMATAQCHHEHVAAIHDLLELGGRTFMVLEYVPGPGLNTLLSAGRALDPALTKGVARGLLGALTRVHEAGFVHCDVKPANIIVGPGCTAKLIDFGIAQRAGHSPSDAVLKPGEGRAPRLGEPDTLDGASGAVMGTASQRDPAPRRFVLRGSSGAESVAQGADGDDHTGPSGTLHYMAPEQWDVASPLDSRTDLWALGLLLFEMHSGQHPLLFTRRGRSGSLHPSIATIPRLEDAVPTAPKALGDLVSACLERDVQRRLASAAFVLQALESIWDSTR